MTMLVCLVGYINVYGNEEYSVGCLKITEAQVELGYKFDVTGNVLDSIFFMEKDMFYLSDLFSVDFSEKK